jgi:hypothetical protein
MLANLESGRVEQNVKQPPVMAVFVTIPDHVRRVVGAGLSAWEQRGPRYVLGENGTLIHAGRFSDAPSTPPQSLRARLLRPFFGPALAFAPSERDYHLYGAIVKASRDQFVKLFPESAFEVIIWAPLPLEQSRASAMERELRAAGIASRRIEDIIPGIAGDPATYYLSRNDRHPNALSDRILSDYLFSLAEQHN